MKKIIYRKFLKDCLNFFLIALISTSIIIWVFQAVNYLDIVIDDGRNYVTYLQYSLLNFPKIVARILPFAFFFSFSYVIAKYEMNNELIIFWSNGIKKINFINYFFVVSIFLFLIQIFLTTIIVPKSQSSARNLMRTSEFNFVENFIKVKKFNATINNLTIYSEDKDKNNSYKNIYIKRKINDDDFQIIFSKKGEFKTSANNPTLLLYDGETINISNENITNFSFEKSEFNLSPFTTNTILVKKTQEHSTKELIECAINLINRTNLEKIIKKVNNCEIKNFSNIISELYKRFVIPLYLLPLMLTILLLIIYSKEKINYSKKRIVVFLIGFFTIIFSETTLRFVNNSNIQNLFIMLLPIFLSFLYYFYYLSILRKN